MEDLYKHRGYFDTYGSDVFISMGLGALTIAITSYTSYQSVLAQVRSNWNEHKCNPIYMPFAGIIMPQPGMSTTDNTIQNFSYCIHQDAAMVFQVAMMPIEFCIFMTIEFMDMVLGSILAFIRLIKWLRDQLGGIFASIYNKIVYFIVPLVEITIHVRDALSRITAIALTSVFVTVTVYKTTVSGLINVMNILCDLLIALISVIVAMILVAFILLMTPAFPVGITMFATGTAVMTAILVPTVILYVLMQTFTSSIMNERGRSAPSIPSIKKRRRR